MGKKKEEKKNSSTSAAEKQPGPASSKKKDNRLPEARVRLGQVDAMVALMRGIDRRVKAIERRIDEPREPVSAPVPPSPHDATFAAIPEFMAEMRTRLCRIECRQEQPERDPRLDVPASVTALRRFFAGACRFANLVRPTPAIVGRVMHDDGAFDRSAAKSPYMLFNSIYNAVMTELRPRPIQGESPDNAIVDYVHLSDEMVELMQGRSSRPQDKHATYYDSQLKPRIRLLEHMRLACVEENRTGRRLDYSRYLTPSGRELFNGWPEWTDATGGIRLADEQAESPPSQSDLAGPDGGATQPAT